ncbi:MAG: hypothetical protein WD767_17370 [Alphaproteobacteria bacterium]
MARKPGNGVAGGAKAKGAALAWVIAPAIFVLAPSTVILLMVGMAPTIVALLLLDRHPLKYTSRTVGYLNFAGCLMYTLDLWKNSGFWDFSRLIEIISNPFSLLVMYSAAAVGWIILYLTPPVVASYLTVSFEMKETRYKARQKELVETWGRNVRYGDMGMELEDDTEAEKQDDAEKPPPPAKAE